MLLCKCMLLCTCVSSHIVSSRLVLRGGLDGVGQEAEDGSDPQQDGESSEELSAEFDPLRGGGGWGESVGTVPSEVLRRLGISQTLQGTRECEKKSDSESNTTALPLEGDGGDVF